MSNYTPRYMVEVDSAKHGEVSRVGWIDTDDREDALEFVELMDQDRNASLVDRALSKRAGTSEGARDRGYYGLRYSGTDRLSYMLGKIDRSADDALDRLDKMVDRMEYESSIRNYGEPTLTEQVRRVMQEVF